MPKLRSIALSTFFFAGVIACGGATQSVLFDGDGGSSGDGATDGAADAARDVNPNVVPPDLLSCSLPTGCELGAKGCCGIGCQPDSQLVAIVRGSSEALRTATCDSSGPVACPACARQLEPNIQAFCESGQCSVVDVRTSPMSACAGNQDCSLRYASCCEPCNGGAVGEILALAKTERDAYAAQVCGGSAGCDKCLPIYPQGMTARCNLTTGHCEVKP